MLEAVVEKVHHIMDFNITEAVEVEEDMRHQEGLVPNGQEEVEEDMEIVVVQENISLETVLYIVMEDMVEVTAPMDMVGVELAMDIVQMVVAA